MGQIEIDDYLHEKLNELTYLLYQKKYFSYLDSAIKYVSGIYTHIRNPDNYRTLNPCKIDKYGQYYIKYKPTRSTTQYYITYDIVDGIYYVQDIFSDKSTEYARYIKGTK